MIPSGRNHNTITLRAGKLGISKSGKIEAARI